ncbi:unnamed protein product [Cuscuta epithymum]|uniref:Uncharacterized protein n=1 Tax=Cuscuta epithymum TaxID=186058 RepID=A0AAV0CRE9_9ASTE|nr:unnamed protein product [Cuscuta epithymum]CAH9124414.1 unnamed protein product [Cuscuta epithymum]
MEKAKQILRFFGNPGEVAGSGSVIDEFGFVEDLSSWEFVIPSDDDDDDACFLNDEVLDGDESSAGMKQDDTVLEFGLKQDRSCPIGSPSSGASMESPSPDQISVPLDVAAVALVEYGSGSAYGPDCGVEEEDEEDDDYDLDDELGLYLDSYSFGKQRTKKVKKMTCPRMKIQRRLPYYYNKPGATWKIR